MLDVIFYSAFALIAGALLYSVLSKRARGKMYFGGEIAQTWDGVKSKGKMTTTKVKVHAIRISPGVKMVGLELSASTIASYQMLPISLPPSEALELSRMLREAAEYETSGGAT